MKLSGFVAKRLNALRRLRSELELSSRVKNFYLASAVKRKFSVRQRSFPDIFADVSRRVQAGSKRILLVYPPKAPNMSTAYGENVSLALIHRKREAELAGWKVEILNLAKERQPSKALQQFVKSFDPQIVGFSTTSPSESMAFSLAKSLHQSGLSRHRLVIKGGPGTEYSFSQVNRSLGARSPIDVFFLGDADPSFRSFLGAVESGKISGLAHVPGIGLAQRVRTGELKSSGADISKRVVANAADIEAMKEQPFPSLLFAKEKARRGNTSELFGRIQTMTNCAFGCGFCAVSNLRGAQTRMSVEDAVSQVKEMAARGIRNFYFEDATFLTDTMRSGRGIFTWAKGPAGEQVKSQSFAGWTGQFLAEMKKLKAEEERNGHTIRFGIQTRIDSLNENIIKELAEAGCTNVFLGVETLEAGSLKRMHKGETYVEERLRELFRSLLKSGINPTASLIVGHYTGGLKNFEYTIGKMQEFGVQEIFMQAAAVYPGTGDWRKMKPQEGKHVVLSYLSPDDLGSGVSRKGVNPEDQMQYHRWDTKKALNTYYRSAEKILGKGFVRVNPGHYLRKRIYFKYREAFA